MMTVSRATRNMLSVRAAKQSNTAKEGRDDEIVSFSVYVEALDGGDSSLSVCLNPVVVEGLRV